MRRLRNRPALRWIRGAFIFRMQKRATLLQSCIEGGRKPGMCVPTALPVSLAILMLRSLDKQMPRGYTDHREMIRMNENEMLQTILSEIKSMNGEIASINKRLDGLEAGQKDMRTDIKEVHHRLDTLEAGQNDMRADMKEVNRRLDFLENGQKEANRRLDTLEAGQNDMRADMKEVHRRLDTLEEGQKTIRRDVARVERKVDRLGNDVGDTLAIVTEATDYEISKLREAK